MITKKIGYTLFSQLTKLNVNRAKDNYEISEIDRFQDGMDEFWSKISEYYHYIVERDRAYLNWRYCDPVNDYSVFIAEENGEVLGFIVLDVVEKQRDYPEGYVLDLITLPGREGVADGLLGSALKLFDVRGVNAVNCLLIADHPIEASLRRGGFVDSMSENNLFYMPIGGNDILTGINSVHCSKIHICYGDLFLS